MRARMAASAPPSERAGSTRCASVPRPDTGSHPSSMAKTIASSGPSQKFGTDTPASASAVAPESIAVPRHTAAAMPSGSATSSATNIAAPASSAVAGMREATCETTGSPVRSDVPRSPRTAPDRNPTYCSSSGRSSPSRRRSSSTSACGAVSPSIACAGSPGMRWIREKTRVATPNSTGTVSTRRRAR